MAAKGTARLLTDDGQYRLVIEARIVQARDQMGRTGPGRRNADTELSGKLRIGDAMKAAISSCRAWINSISPLALFRAPKTPFIPSPGYPNILLTPHARRRSTTKSPTVSVNFCSCLFLGGPIALFARQHTRSQFCFDIARDFNHADGAKFQGECA